MAGRRERAVLRRPVQPGDRVRASEYHAAATSRNTHAAVPDRCRGILRFRPERLRGKRGWESLPGEHERDWGWGVGANSDNGLVVRSGSLTACNEASRILTGSVWHEKRLGNTYHAIPGFPACGHTGSHAPPPPRNFSFGKIAVLAMDSRLNC
jgi:hypothetical protein